MDVVYYLIFWYLKKHINDAVSLTWIKKIIYVSTKKINDQIKFQQIRLIDARDDRKNWRNRTEENEFSRRKYVERTDCYRMVDNGRLGRSVIIFRQAIR